ncbi:hypothetical protein [Vibrio alfacsensis]|uniref:hypothetical protein n=1 Tax=Vibrio TaxID=662 RepID=UPI0040676BE4
MDDRTSKRIHVNVVADALLTIKDATKLNTPYLSFELALEKTVELEASLAVEFGSINLLEKCLA